MPSPARPPERTSRADTCLASKPGDRKATAVTSVCSRTVLVTAARKFRTLYASSRSLSYGPRSKAFICQT